MPVHSRTNMDVIHANKSEHDMCIHTMVPRRGERKRREEEKDERRTREKK